MHAVGVYGKGGWGSLAGAGGARMVLKAREECCIKGRVYTVSITQMPILFASVCQVLLEDKK